MMIGLGNLGHLGKLGHASTSGTNHPEVEASGRAFPIWNTKPGDDKLLSLSIHGLTEQIGTPTPENPVPMRSVGDTGLFLSVMPDKAGSDYQLLNIKEAMKKAGHDGILRSVNGIYDEVVYNGKEWKLIQRIQNDRIISCTGVSNHTDLGFCDCYFYPTKAPINGSTTNGLLSTHFVQGNNGVGTINLNNNSPYLGIFRYPTTVNMTKEEITAWLGENEVYVSYQLAEPAEYPLDLPVITTYDEQTYFASNAADVKPRMVAQCQVSKALDYIREGLIGYYTGRGRSNTDENKNILPDLSGNGNDLENKNFAYTPESGYGDGYIQYDGVDDYSMLPTDKNFKSGVKTQMFVFSATQSTTETDNKWNGGIVTEYYFAIQRNQVSAKSNYEQVYLNGKDVKSIGFNINGSTDVNNIVISRSINTEYFNRNFNISTILNASIYCLKQRCHDVLLYDKILTEEEIKHNYKASCQYNGENIDGKAEETTASGENGFTVYNSLPGIFEELTVYGKSIQDGTPTPANPIPINSIGDTPLILTISNGTETQQINFGDIKLRSVGTVSDELVFDNSVGKWKLIQRIYKFNSSDSGINLYKDKNWNNVGLYFRTTESTGIYPVAKSNSFTLCDKAKQGDTINIKEDNTISKIFYNSGDKSNYISFGIGDRSLDDILLNNYRDYNIYYIINAPIETELDFDAPKTFSGEVTVTTNQETVLPYMTARIAVGEKLTLPDSPLAVYIAGKQTTGEMVFKDQSGNGNDIPLFNIAHSAESGFFQGALHLDGVDDTGSLPLESFNPKITAETSFFLSGKVNEIGNKYFSYFRSINNTSLAVTRLEPENTGDFIAYYPLALTGNPDVNLLNTYRLTYKNNNLLDKLLSPANSTYYNLAGFLQGQSQFELEKLDYRYLIIYPRNLTEEEQAIVLKYIKQGIYEL